MNSAKKFSMAATLVGLGAVSSLAEIKVNDNLSLSGFLDMSATFNTETEVGTMTFDQFEVDFMYKFDKLSARADVNYAAADTSLGGVGGSNLVKLEQAFLSYAIGSGATNLTIGRFLSVSGFEAAEPTGLYQFSTNKALRYGGYQTGLSLGYNGGMFGLYGAVVTNPWASNDPDVTLPGFEAQIALMPTSAITFKATAVVDLIEDEVDPDEMANQQLYNAWIQYAAGALTAAGEFSYLIDYAKDKGMGYMAMVNYKIGANYAVTLRHSGWIPDGEDLVSEVTLSPSVVLTPNWSALVEARVDLGEKDDAGDDLTPVTLAAETIFTF